MIMVLGNKICYNEKNVLMIRQLATSTTSGDDPNRFNFNSSKSDLDSNVHINVFINSCISKNNIF